MLKIKEKSDKFYCSKYDTVFKNVIACEKGKNILKAIIEDALKITIDEIELINTQLEKGSVKEQSKTTDCIVKTGKTLINIEINTSNSISIRNRNARFIMTKHISQFRSGDNYYTIKKSIQINLDWNASYKEIKKEYMFKNISEPYDIYTDKIKIYAFNMDKIRELCYTKEKEDLEYKYLSLIAIDDKERLVKYSKGDKLMEEYSKETIKLNDADIYKDILKKEEDDELVRQSELMYAKDEGKIEVAKNMLRENIDISFISKVTGLPLEVIEKIEK